MTFRVDAHKPVNVGEDGTYNVVKLIRQMCKGKKITAEYYVFPDESARYNTADLEGFEETLEIAKGLNLENR